MQPKMKITGYGNPVQGEITILIGEPRTHGGHRFQVTMVARHARGDLRISITDVITKPNGKGGGSCGINYFSLGTWGHPLTPELEEAAKIARKKVFGK